MLKLYFLSKRKAVKFLNSVEMHKARAGNSDINKNNEEESNPPVDTDKPIWA